MTAFQCWRSRKIVGWVLAEKPNSETIRAAFAMALRDDSNLGGCDSAYLDNGVDFSAYFLHAATKVQRRQKVLAAGYMDEGAFTGLFGMLQIDVIWAKPYNARAKGRLEKWFDYGLHQPFDKIWPTYAGNCPENRPEGLDALLRDKANVPSFEHVHAALAEHIDAWNRSTKHGFVPDELDGLSPHDYYLANARPRELADPGVLDHFMLTYSEPVNVHRNGVTIRPLGKATQYGADSQELVALKGTGRKVRVGYRQDDLRRAWVFDAESMKLICQVWANDPGLRATEGVGRQQLGDALARQRNVNGYTIHCHRKLTARELAVEIATVLGVGGDKQRSAAYLVRRIVKAIKDRSCSIFLNEAQQLTPECASLIRTIHDQTSVPIIMLGSHEIFQFVDDRATGGGQFARRTIKCNIESRMARMADPENPGKVGRPLYSKDEVRRFLASRQIRLADESTFDMLWRIACLTKQGTLGLLNEIVEGIAELYGDEPVRREVVASMLFMQLENDAELVLAAVQDQQADEQAEPAAA